ncbi:hypothetical protein G3I59_19495 [Amycolatopsis rubida]|uniref:Uncharacterized protein n=1 Tax=Amycolatopsis rubida TaxID=112413 RepID=A0ABX0BTY9_9PSEU|nr:MULTISPECIES: hypothetical protein [Amycolatopsis]NEC57719.1 hypothetical protein [Amycolatopsis rubida]
MLGTNDDVAATFPEFASPAPLGKTRTATTNAATTATNATTARRFRARNPCLAERAIPVPSEAWTPSPFNGDALFSSGESPPNEDSAASPEVSPLSGDKLVDAGFSPLAGDDSPTGERPGPTVSAPIGDASPAAE